ncbi:AcrR family transcriptional regulator [Kibdelosporangium banguiense]|uniref:AcrR family transcriptional regulator n=1 Tax=Kibdelosporangium banguiense TaxID=1365924 RepID=A0ABS4TJ77_9PSEU|nr:TetR/AcrR family transcriptional regulator [Kibdelosporangium banguiense]MBP2324483.1 AcrR family transcriptional regulator [Kibdelosporangium banguiense]
MSTEYGGSGDLSISLKLLWRRQERPSRGPKPSLTVDRIAQAGIELADAEGLTALSMRRVAKHLGVGTMSLYRYVPSKAELVEVMLDLVYADEASWVDVGEGTWRENLEKLARGTRELHLKHKWLLQISQARPMLGPNVLASFERSLEVLTGTGLTGAEMLNVIGLVDGYVIGATRNEIDAGQAAERTGVTDEQFWAAHEPFLVEMLSTGNYPLMAGLTEDVFQEMAATSFDFGLQRVLDGIETLINVRQKASRGPTPGVQ